MHGQVVREGSPQTQQIGKGESPFNLQGCIQSHPQLGGSQSGARFVKWLLRKVVWQASSRVVVWPSTHCREN